MDLHQIDKNRLNFLQEIYHEAKSDKRTPIKVQKIATKLGLDRQNGISIADYLIGENWLTGVSHGHVYLSQYGINKVEEILRNKNKEKRSVFLSHLYKCCNGNINLGFSMWELGAELGFDASETQSIVNFFIEQEPKLIEFKGGGGAIGLTPYGVEKIEEADKVSSESLGHRFPINITQNTVNVDKMENSILQQATHNSTINAYYNNAEIKELDNIIEGLNDIKKNLDSTNESHGELKNEIEILEKYVQPSKLSSKPKVKISIVNELLKSIRATLEGAAGGIIATIMVEPTVTKITNFLVVHSNDLKMMAQNYLQ